MFICRNAADREKDYTTSTLHYTQEICTRNNTQNEQIILSMFSCKNSIKFYQIDPEQLQLPPSQTVQLLLLLLPLPLLFSICV